MHTTQTEPETSQLNGDVTVEIPASVWADLDEILTSGDQLAEDERVAELARIAEDIGVAGVRTQR